MWVSGSAGAPLKSLLSGKRADVVPALPSGYSRKSLSSFPWAQSEAENLAAGAGCVTRQGGKDRPGICGDPGGPDTACGSLLCLSLCRAGAAFAPAQPGSSCESEPGVPRP